MRLASVEFRDFRSFWDCRLEPDAAVNVFVGPNGAGKTSLLEAISYLSTLRSFRRVPDQALVREGAAAFVVRGSVERRSGSSTLAVEVPTSGRRRVELNGKPFRAARELPGHLRIVVFFPDDLDVLKRDPGGRRDFIDEVAEQLWSGAGADLSEYGRAVRQRTALLKRFGSETADTTLDVWDEKVSHTGARVLARRRRALDMLENSVSEIYSRLARTDSMVEAAYRSSWGGELSDDDQGLAGQLHDALRKVRSKDKERRMTTVGPHRDDPGWILDGRETRTHLSQGEQRSLALALRLSSRHAILEQTGDPPVLLLDDVFSELDLDRSEALTDVLPEGQSFITTTREEDVPVVGRRWSVMGGRVR